MEPNHSQTFPDALLTRTEPQEAMRGQQAAACPPTAVVLKQHEGRLKRLEDFMDGLMRKAG